MSPSSITIDEALWPLVIIRFNGDPSPGQFADYLARMSFYLRQEEHSICILDASQVRSATAEQRHLQAAWIREHEVLLRQWMLGSAHVITSPVIRLVTSLILHLQPLPTPHIVVPDMRAAVAWVLVRLEDAALTEEAQRIRRHFGL
jgi:hypothetical protein